MPVSLIFPSWWQALSAVPPGKTARDWWAQEDARCPRYDRLCRVWGDPTDGSPPPYYKADKEKHIVPTLWENFAIFNPTDIIAALYRDLEFEAPGPAVDLCWSCEFNLGHQDRQLDIVMHVRFADRDEIVVGEGKAGRKGFDDKDLCPRDVLSREVFRFAGTRRYFLLGDASPPQDWQTRGYRHLTWHRLYALQVALCETLPESSPVREFVRRLISAQFAGHRITTDSGATDTNIGNIQRDAGALLSQVTTERCGQFIACAIQHLRCLAGLHGDSLPIAYLALEPKVEHITRHWRLGCGGRAVNEKAYWKLPARHD